MTPMILTTTIKLARLNCRRGFYHPGQCDRARLSPAPAAFSTHEGTPMPLTPEQEITVNELAIELVDEEKAKQNTAPCIWEMAYATPDWKRWPYVVVAR